jgi:peptide/nickel transport system substrate-binding protein
MTDRYVLLPQQTLAPEYKAEEEIISHPNFIKALSVAIDRAEINESLFFGQATMGQVAPMPNSRYYKKEYGEAWAQFDKDLANKLLDEMGLDKRGADGFRLRLDGQPFEFLLQHSGVRVGAVADKFTEMAVSYWREVGINAITKEISENLYRDRMKTGQVQCGLWHNDRCTDMLIHIEPNWYVPVSLDAIGGYRWGEYWQAADKSTLPEPPKWVLDLFEWYNQVKYVMDENERLKYMQMILDKLAKDPIAIGVVQESPAPLIINRNMRNLPRAKVPVGWDSYGLSTYHPEAFYYEGGKRA